MEPLFHIVTQAAWKAETKAGKYEPPSLKKEGFVHLSRREQLAGTANLFFRGQKDLMVLEILIPSSDPRLKWEEASGPTDKFQLFPHYYGPIRVEWVRKQWPLEAGRDGSFLVPVVK